MTLLDQNSSVADFRALVNTPARLYAFQCYGSVEFVMEGTLFVALVEGFRNAAKRRKAQVALLHQYFVEGEPPPECDKIVFQLNLNAKNAKAAVSATAAIRGLRTFKDKRAQLGFRGALRTMGGRTVPGADLFDRTQGDAWTVLLDPLSRAPFDPDGDYEMRPDHKQQMSALKARVTAAGWDAEACGIRP